MDAQTFYEEFKAALDYVGVGFTGKGDAEVSVLGNSIAITHEKRRALISLYDNKAQIALNVEGIKK